MGEVQQFMRLVAAFPEDPWLRLKLGEAFLERGQLENALGELRSASRAPGYDAVRGEAGLLRGRALLTKGRTAAAQDALLEALEADLRPAARREATRLLGRARRLRVRGRPPELEPAPGARRVIAGSARVVLEAAQSEVFNAGHRLIGTLHVLLGLVREGGELGALLRRHGATLEGVRGKLHLSGAAPVRWPRPGQAAPECQEATPRCKQLLRLAHREAVESGAAAVSPVHLLAAMLALPRCIARETLTRLGLDLEVLEGEVARLLEKGDTVDTAWSVERRSAGGEDGLRAPGGSPEVAPLLAIPCSAEPPVGYLRPPERPAPVGSTSSNRRWLGLQGALTCVNALLAVWLALHLAGTS